MIGRDYRALRKAARMNQWEWAKAIGVSQSLISRWESNDGPPPAEEYVARMQNVSPQLDPTEVRLKKLDEQVAELVETQVMQAGLLDVANEELARLDRLIAGLVARVPAKKAAKPPVKRAGRSSRG